MKSENLIALMMSNISFSPKAKYSLVLLFFRYIGKTKCSVETVNC